MYGVRKQQLKILNLFLLADGIKSATGIEKMNAIYDAMNVEQLDREEIERYCSNALYYDGSKDNSAQIIQIMKSILEEDKLTPLLFLDNLNANKPVQVETIWNLLNLGYSDKEYSEPEKKIINFLCDYWKVDKKIFKELEDSVETLASLFAQKDWVKTTHKSYDEINNIITHIDNDIQRVSQNVNITIGEVEL